MPLISVQELHQQATKVLQRVREEKVQYTITYQGHPIALLLPVDTKAVEAAMIETDEQSVADGWDACARIAEQMRQTWPAEQKTRHLLNTVRQ